jgi:hypothetical protein
MLPQDERLTAKDLSSVGGCSASSYAFTSSGRGEEEE